LDVSAELLIRSPSLFKALAPRRPCSVEPLLCVGLNP